MIKSEQVPKEATEAAAVHLSNGRTTSQALAAAINAWPGMFEQKYHDEAFAFHHIILPITTQEKRDE